MAPCYIKHSNIAPSILSQVQLKGDWPVSLALAV
jgi:hypothetical protein